MRSTVERGPSVPVLLLVIEQMGVMRLKRFLGSDEGRWLASFLDECTQRRLDLITPSGRNGIAASLATGVTPQEHGVVGNREPDPISMEIRNVDSYSWLYDPFWSLLSSQNRSCCTVGWPVSEPTSAFADNGNCAQVLVAPACYESRDDPRDAWLLPPRCVFPEDLRPLVRSCRVHQDDLEEDDLAESNLKSIESIAISLREQCNPDLLACWLVSRIARGQEQDGKSLLAIAQTVRRIIESTGDCSIAILCLPSIQMTEQRTTDAAQCQLFLRTGAIDPSSIPLAIRDVDLVPLIFRMLGMEFEPSQRIRPNTDGVIAMADQRARGLVKAGHRPRKTHGRQRVYTRLAQVRLSTIGSDLLARGDFALARRWLEEGVRGDGGALVPLILSLIGARDVERLDRLASINAVPTFIRSISRIASFLLRGDTATALKALTELDAVGPVQIALRGEMFLRAGDPVAASDDFERVRKSLVRLSSSRQLRLSLIAARRAGRDSVVVDLARILLYMRPLEVRRRRLMARG